MYSCIDDTVFLRDAAKIPVSSLLSTVTVSVWRSPSARSSSLWQTSTIGFAIDFVTIIERIMPKIIQISEDTARPIIDSLTDDVISAIGATTPYDQPSVLLIGA